MSGQEGLSAREHALRVAVLSVIDKEVTAALKAARRDAEAAYAPLRADGQTQQKVLMPDGDEIGLISILGGGKAVEVTEDALQEWLRKHNLEGLEDYLDADAAVNAEVLDVVRTAVPGMVKTRIRPDVRRLMLDELKQTGGYLIDKSDGESEKVADVVSLRPSGAFSYRPGPDARDKIIGAWRRGELAAIALDALALPAPERRQR